MSQMHKIYFMDFAERKEYLMIFKRIKKIKVKIRIKTKAKKKTKEKISQAQALSHNREILVKTRITMAIIETVIIEAVIIEIIIIIIIGNLTRKRKNQAELPLFG